MLGRGSALIEYSLVLLKCALLTAAEVRRLDAIKTPVSLSVYFVRVDTTPVAAAAMMRYRTLTWTIHVTLAVFTGFVLGSLAARRQQQPYQEPHEQQLTRRHIGRGGKRKSRPRKSEAGTGASAAPATTFDDGPAAPTNHPTHAQQQEGSPLESTGSRRSRKRERNRRLSPKDLALDAFTKVARSHLSCFGAGDFQSLLLLPRATFIDATSFIPYAACSDRLVTLGQARAATAGVDQLQILYVSCSWASAGEAKSEDDDFETVRAFLERNSDVGYVYIGHSCVASDEQKEPRAVQLRHTPLALLRADFLLVLPRIRSPCTEDEQPATSPNDGEFIIRRGNSDLSFHARGAWSCMELALAAVGQAMVYIACRVAPFPEIVWELKPGMTDVKEVTKKAAGALTAAASGVPDMSLQEGKGELEAEDEAMVMAATALAQTACQNWLSTELNPLAALEKARRTVVDAENSVGAGLLNAIQGMRSTPSSALTEDLRRSLGQEHVAGERELAMSLLLFAVFCAQRKERATYTDKFLEDAKNAEVVYQPIAVVRSPYRERFGTPRQPQVTAAVLHGGAQEGQIVFVKDRGYGEANMLIV